jgi:hypothetical protein
MKVKLNGNDFYEVSSKFGVMDNVHKTAHTGIDLVMKTGTKLFSPTDGVVSKIVDYGDKNIGRGIIIKTDSGENVIMGHLSEAKVHVGEKLHEGDFIALSGNTGHSTGSHLHLGLKSENGYFINPHKLLNENDNHNFADTFISNGKVEATSFSGDNGMIDNMRGFMDFIRDVKSEGLFHAIYGDSFFGVMSKFFSELFHDFWLFLLGNGDIFFLLPAILFMFGTFFVGKNKYSKFIIPLWFGYFVTSVLSKILQ